MKSPQGQSVRYRVCVSRLGAARDLTHLAQIELLRRSVLASRLPAVMDKRRKRLRPKLAFGPAISKGYESMAEYFDLELTSLLSAEEVGAALGKNLCSGFALTHVRRIPRFFPSLDASINVVRYVIRGTFPDTARTALKKFVVISRNRDSESERRGRKDRKGGCAPPDHTNDFSLAKNTPLDSALRTEANGQAGGAFGGMGAGMEVAGSSIKFQYHAGSAVIRDL